MDITQTLEILMIAIIAGIIGSMLGLGGGIIMTPALTLIFGIPIQYAIGASIISVIATSSGSAIAYIKDRITNLRVGMFLEIATTTGAITGAFIGGLLSETALYMIFGLLLLYSAFNMIKKSGTEIPTNVKPDPLATKLNLHDHYYDKALRQEINYKVAHIPAGFGVMYGAGVASGLLGIGSGAFKVMALDVFMKMPLKVSSATSNLMMGVTAAASATVYLFKGDIDPTIAAPVALGVLIGATFGTRIMQRLKSKVIRLIFIPILIYVALQMILEGLGWI
ncbi:sulfite exporter TauE/SafE family protein [Listeria sp. PSOL-1]|uniref:sulfite exporter TauE/SafE family protein n=1 Tax=Listeria sp. PSOL-1 TaxID=1844999 RepID=UPI0013D7ACDF|nr:sulfite exporter TauE/SafE family protein [Listeria sp. PSOL-1]